MSKEILSTLGVDYLKPCPFCGSEAVLNHIPAHTHIIPNIADMKEDGNFIECMRCSAVTSNIEHWQNRVTEQPGGITHELYEDGDAKAPECIKDRNGEVVLGLCKKCGKGEAELVEPCVASSHDPIEQALIWLDAALNCKDWHWDGDQWDAAKWAYDNAMKQKATMREIGEQPEPMREMILSIARGQAQREINSEAEFRLAFQHMCNSSRVPLEAILEACDYVIKQREPTNEIEDQEK